VLNLGGLAGPVLLSYLVDGGFLALWGYYKGINSLKLPRVYFPGSASSIVMQGF
jgi:hypothetical protein